MTIELLDGAGQVIATTITDADGDYLFDQPAAGHLRRARSAAGRLLRRRDEAGSAGGTLGDDFITHVVLTSGVDAVHYDFCEMLPVSICGFVHVQLPPATARIRRTRRCRA